MELLHGNECRVLADATVELVSKVIRPYVFRVTVTGLPPHAHTRQYQISAPSDDSAAMKGLQLFEAEFSMVQKVVDRHERALKIIPVKPKELTGVRFK
jgi:hypothetical protein